jgi:hypothetical protein
MTIKGVSFDVLGVVEVAILGDYEAKRKKNFFRFESFHYNFHLY